MARRHTLLLLLVLCPALSAQRCSLEDVSGPSEGAFAGSAPGAPVEIVFSADLPSSVTRTVVVPAGGADVDISLRDCCVRDDKVEVYVNGCFVAEVVSDDPTAPRGSHAGETHTVSLDEGVHVIEYRNTFSRVGPSGWLVSETLHEFTGDFVPCGIDSVSVVCRPLADLPGDELHTNPKAARHCYFLVLDTVGNRSTYSAFPNADPTLPPWGNLVPKRNGDPLDPPGGCGSGTFESVCIEVEESSGQTLERIVEGLESAIAAGAEGKYHNVTNNSNLWVQRRIDDLSLDVALPVSAVRSRTTALFQFPVAVAKWVVCKVEVSIINKLKCAIFDVCE